MAKGRGDDARTTNESRGRSDGGRAWILNLIALLSVQCCTYYLLFASCPGEARLISAAMIAGGDVPPVVVVATSNAANATSSANVAAAPKPSVASASTIDASSSLASRESFGFFYDVTDEHWELLRRIYREHSNHFNPERPLQFNPENDDKRGIETWGDPEMFSSYKAWYQSNYEPNFSCQFERRVGSNMNGDGPKWVCDPHRIRKLAADRRAKVPDSPGCVVYSVGSSGSFVFEMGMQREMGEGTCEYHIFDYGDYERKVPKELKRAHYHRWGLTRQDTNDEPKPGRAFRGLRDTVKLLGHEGLDVIDVFKIDCEKCEWDTFRDWLSEDVPLLHQILVEVHGAPGQTAVDFFDTLEGGGYLRFHKEPNIQYNPGCVEYAFVKVETSFMEEKEGS